MLMAETGWIALAVAAGFVMVSGRNDGGALVVSAMAGAGLRPAVASVLAAAAVGLVPALLGARVATTLSASLVDFGGQSSDVTLILVLLVAMAVVAAVSMGGLPTSVTLALVGATVGAGWGIGLPVAWGRLALLVTLATAAPVAAAVIALGIARASAMLPAIDRLPSRLARAQVIAFVALAIAYGANDGQKVLAVLALASGTTAVAASTNPSLIVVGALTFGAGTWLGLRKTHAALGRGMVRPRPAQNVVVQLAASVTVLIGSALRSPMSTTQSLAGGMVGTGIDTGWLRVRWESVLRIGLVWLVTLPLAAGAAAGAGTLLRVLR